MRMLNKIILIFVFAVFGYASIVDDYISEKYEKICTFKNIHDYRNDEKALSIIGVSCVKLDNIYMLSYLINKLKKTDFGRKNAIYFLTILMQKKLLYSYLFDNMPLNSFNLPLTDYVLSYVFEKIKNKEFQKQDGVIIIKGAKEGVVYKVYKNEDKMYLDEYMNDNLTKRRWYK